MSEAIDMLKAVYNRLIDLRRYVAAAEVKLIIERLENETI
jgi:hypothetical protein